MSLRRSASRTTRACVAAALTIAVSSWQLAPASAAANAGDRCTRIGTITWHGKTKLRCTKVGKRLVWRVAVAAKPKPGPQADADTMLGTACADPGHELLHAAGAIRCTGGVWATIAPATDSVATRAYRNLMAQYWANPASTTRLSIVSDTETAYAINVLERGMRAADRLWSAKIPAQPFNIVIARSAQSLNTQAVALGLVLPDVVRASLEAQESKYGGCGQGKYLTRLARPWLFFCFGQAPTDDSAAARAFGDIGAHEYTHLAQFVLMDDMEGRRTSMQMAPWFAEGLASYIMMSLGDVGGAGGDLRTYWLQGLESTTATLADFNYRNLSGTGAFYSLGLFATEALYALEGTGIADRLLRACGTGLSFSTAMKKVTGHSLEEWTPVLSAYVASVKARTPLTLAELQALRRTTLPGAK